MTEKNCTTSPWKKSPPLSQQPPCKNWDTIKPPSSFENLVGDSLPSGVHTMFSIQLFAGSTLVSFQFLWSSFVSCLPWSTLTMGSSPSSVAMLLIQPSFLATWPNQCNRLYCNVCTLLIPSSSRRVRAWTHAVFQTHITYPPNHNTTITIQF